MASNNHKAYLSSDSHLDDEYRQILQSKPEMKSMFQFLFDKFDLKEQIPLLKKMSCIKGDNFDDADLVLQDTLSVLVNIYLNCTNKHTVKRILASTFQNYGPQVKQLMQPMMINQVKNKEKCSLESRDLGSIRHCVDIVTGLLDNFPFGEECLKLMALQVLEFLAAALDVFMQRRSPEMSPVQQNEVMHHCLATVQSTNRLMHKCMKEVDDANQSEDRKERLQLVSQKTMESAIDLLQTENVLLDCKTSCGMSVVLLLKLNHRSSVVPLVMKFMNDTIQWSDTQPDWLGKVDLSHLNMLTPISRLCLYYGILAQLDSTDLTSQLENKTTLITDVFLNKILVLGKSCLDTSSKLLASKCVLLWTSKAWSCLKVENLSNLFVKQFLGSSPLMQQVLQFVWATWEDTVDVIRFTAKDIFENIIRVDSLATQSSDVVKEENKFIMDLTELLFDISWTCKGKFGALSILAEHIGTSKLLGISPSLPTEVLEQMKEQTLACYGSELYHKLSTTHLQELAVGQHRPVTTDKQQKEEQVQKRTSDHGHAKKAPAAPNTTWLELWVRPVVTTLTEAEKHHKTHIIEYVLPKLLKTGVDTLHYIIKLLPSPTSNQVGALITCLRRARVMGLLKTPPPAESDSAECLYGVVSKAVVRQALCHSEEQVRLDAFALLCENHKTSEPIAKFEFDLLKYFLLWNLNNQSPSFRQHLLAHVKKLFLRYQESERALRRQLSTAKHDNLHMHLVSYENFLSWMFTLLLHSLYPGSAFARRTTSLSMLSLMVDIFGAAQDSAFVTLWKACHLQTLVECLNDTFEENRIEAFKVLQYCFSQRLYLEEKTQFTNMALFEICMDLAGSTRPQDCTTACYLFRVLLLQPDVTNCFLENGRTLEKFLSSEKLKSWKDLIGGSNGLEKVLGKYTNQASKTLLLLWILLLYLQDQTDVAKTTLFIAAAKRPMYPTLHCIRNILFDVKLRELSQEEIMLWKVFIEKLIAVCLEISEVVSPVVQNSSPEGNIPTDTLEDVQSVLKSKDTSQKRDAEKSMERVMLMPEYLVVCCWRNVKEVSLLLGQLTLEAPIEDPEISDVPGLLSVQQILVIGNYFIKQLLESIHRGAFELACAGFVKQCQMLWRSKIRALHQLLKLWLDQVMTDIIADDVNNKLCATRRSAGIPFYVQTLLSTEPASTGRPCFNSVMMELLKLAKQEDKRADIVPNSKVHALNILHALYRDTRLAEVVTPYVADGLQVAILGFHSPCWAVRNSATMLLSAMMVRIFGVKRSKDETNMSKKNCQTGRQFFHQFPSLYKFLLDQLSGWTQDMRDSATLHLSPGLYPVLMVLGRLFHSPLEGADTSLSLSAFIPYIIRCSCSSVMKTRNMAARALQPLVQKDQLIQIFTELLSLIPDSRNGRELKQSHIHGILLQLHAMLDLLSTQSDETLAKCQDAILSTWKEKLWLISINDCFITKSQSLEVTNKILKLFPWQPQMTKEDTRLVLFNHYVESLTEMYRQEIYGDLSKAHIPGFVESVTRICKLYINHLVEVRTPSEELVKKLTKLLTSKFYDVRIVVLDEVKKLFTNYTAQRCTASEVKRSRSENDQDDISTSYALLERLFNLALYEEQHFECQIKVFETLSYSPLMRSSPWKDFSTDLNSSQILHRCLEMFQVTKREEVKAAILQFTRWLIPDMIHHLTQAVEEVKVLELFRTWTGVLKDSISTEQSPDLQLSVAMVIEHNAETLLKDSHVLGEMVFDFWDILVNLQQEDDLDVKNVIATVMTKLDGDSVAGHTSLTLDLLVCKMVDIHGGRCVPVLMKWLIHDNDNGVVREGERLFDRSEMNTFREEVIFTQIIVKYLLKLINGHRVKSKATNNPPIVQGNDVTGDCCQTSERGSINSERGFVNSDGGLKQDDITSGLMESGGRQSLESKLQLVQDLCVSEVTTNEEYCHSNQRDIRGLVCDIDSYLETQTEVLMDYGKYFSGCSPVTYETPFFATSPYQENLLKSYKILLLLEIIKTFCHQEEFNKTLGSIHVKVGEHLKNCSIALNTFMSTLSELST